MPTFTEGQDPLDSTYGHSINLNLPQAPPPPAPLPWELPQAIAEETTDLPAIGRFLNRTVAKPVADALGLSETLGLNQAARGALQASPSDQPVDGYNPVPRIVGTKYEPYLSQFMGDVNPDQTAARMAQIDIHQQNQQTMAQGGWTGTALGLVAQAAEPWYWFIPGGEAVAASRLGVAASALERMGPVARGALTAGEVAAATVPQQAILQNVNPTHSFQESAWNVASNALLAGIIGTGAQFLSPLEKARAGNALEASRRDFQAPPTAPEPHGTDLSPPAAPPLGPEPQPAAGQFLSPASLSAATTDRRTMELEPWHAFGLRNLVGTFGSDAQRLYDAATTKAGWLSPISRIFSRGSLPARQYAGDIADTALHFTQEREGITPAQGGLALEAQRDQAVTHYSMLNNGVLEHYFADYRNLPENPFTRGRAYIEDIRGQAQGRMNFSQFKSEVYSAMVDGDTHAVPQVEAAAKALRAQVMDPVKGYLSSVKDMNGQALMGDVIEPPKGDKSFAPRFWSKEAIGRDPNRFDSIVSNWLSKQQANKASIQTRLRGLNDQLSWLNDRNKWLNARIEGRRTALEAATNRSEEISRMNQFAYRRSAQLSQPLDDLRQKVRGIQATVQPHLDKLEQLAKDIKAERAGLPGVTGADTALWRLIGANQRLKDAGDIVSTLEGAHEYQDEVQRVIGGFKEGIRGAREQAVGARNQPEAATLAALEKSRADIRKEIAPYIKELNKARKDIGRIEGQRVPGARGGAVFETEIRNRGNVLADRMAGKRDQLNHFTEELGRRNAELADVRKAVEEEVTKWEGNTSAEAKAALKIREKYEAERAAKVLAGTFKGADPTARLTSADAAIDKTVRAILEAPTDLSAEEIMSRAREIRHRIDTDPDGRLPYDEPKADPHGGWASSSDDLRGSLNRRAFAIPTKDVLDFVHTDLEHVIPAYLKNVVPDAMHIERFGDLRATIPQKRINEFYDAQIAKAPTKELAAKIDAKRKRELADVVGMRDRYRGVYGLPTTAWQRNLGRVSRAVMQYNAITMLGSSVLNRLQDVANAVSRRGMLGYMGDGFLPMIGALTRLSKSGQAARDMVKGWGIGVDTAMGHMATSFSDITNDHLPGNRFERGLQTATKGSMWLNLHGPWTDGWRQVAAMAASADHLRSIERIVNGTATERDVRMMAWSGIDQPMAAKIWDNFQNGHTEVNGVKLPNTADWDPAAERAFVNAVRKEANTAVAQPGQERPFLFDHPMGRAALQFRSFEYAAWHKIMLSNLQMGDGRALQGMLSMLAMGALSAWAYSVASGRVEQMTGWSPQDWVKEALLRSGMLGPFSTMNTLQAKLTNGKTDIFRAIGTGKPPQRRDQTNAVEDALGPTFKEAMGLGMAIPHVFSNTTTARDVNNARQTFIPLQNYMFFRRLLDEAEDNFDRHWGIRPMNRNPKAYPGMWTTPQ